MTRILAPIAFLFLLLLGKRLFSTDDWGKPRKR